MTHSVCVKGELKGHMEGNISPSYPLSNHLFWSLLNWRLDLGCCIIYQWNSCSPEKYLGFNPLLPLISKVTCGYESYNIHFKCLFLQIQKFGKKKYISLVLPSAYKQSSICTSSGLTHPLVTKSLDELKLWTGIQKEN